MIIRPEVRLCIDETRSSLAALRSALEGPSRFERPLRRRPFFLVRVWLRACQAINDLDDHWVGDAIGAVALFIMLFGGLCIIEVLR